MSMLLLSLVCTGVYGEGHAHDEEHGHHGEETEHKSGEFDIDDLYFSLIGDISYAASTLSMEDKEHTFIPFLTESHGDHDVHEGHSHILHGENGFNLNYFEVEVLYRPYEGMNLFVDLHKSESGFEIEEMYIEQKGLFAERLDVKAGKFYSNFGIVSSKHSNTWDFANMPITYSALLGNERLLDEGIGFRLHPCHDSPLSFGAEIYQGDGDLFGLEEIGIGGYRVEENSAPNVYTAFLRYKETFGDLTLETGAAYIRGDANLLHDEENPHALDGTTRYHAAHLLLTRHFSEEENLKWQSEYIGRIIEGTRYDESTSRRMEQKSDGFYTQLVYSTDMMEYGIRYDTIFRNEKRVGGNLLPEYDIDKLSAIVNYKFNDFSQLRLEVSRDRTRYEGDPVTGALRRASTDAVLQYIFTFGKEPEEGHNH